MAYTPGFEARALAARVQCDSSMLCCQCDRITGPETTTSICVNLCPYLAPFGMDDMIELDGTVACTNRGDGAHCDARVQCNFRYACPHVTLCLRHIRSSSKKVGVVRWCCGLYSGIQTGDPHRKGLVCCHYTKPPMC